MSELERARARKSNKKITVDDKLELVSFPCPVLLSKGGFTIVFIHLFPLTCPLKLTIITVNRTEQRIPGTRRRFNQQTENSGDSGIQI